ncbi:MAG: alpha/beta hydrolase [Flavobacteriaceae bacterium]|nr:alpha/beta hydrolase [Flavobacteriaceae bacterium]
MNKLTYLTFFAILLFTACSKNESIEPDSGIPVVQAESSYTVLKEENIIYAEGLSHNMTSTSSFTIPLKLDVYYPDNNSTNRPVFMFIHGGSFVGGSKSKSEIISMADYYSSRGWVFVSIDYRTATNVGTNYSGIAPQIWIDSLEQTTAQEYIPIGIAMYAAQRDAKAALRWIVANTSLYKINTDYITVGGGSAGAITAITLGISNQEDFRDEIPLDEDPTLSTTNLNESYVVRSIIDFWGSNIKLETFESFYGVNRYNSSDPEIFIAHGTADPNDFTPYTEAIELKNIYDSLGIYNKLVSLDGAGHGAWGATVNGKNLSEMSFDFLVDRQNLIVE